MIKNIKKIKYEIFVVLFFVLIRVPDLGNDNFNTDVWRWKARTYDFGNGVFTLDFAHTLQTYHPGVTLMWLAGFGVKAFNSYYQLSEHTLPLENNVNTYFQLDFVQKLFIVAGEAVAIAFAFHALRKLFGLRYSLITIFLISFEPFYLALSRVIHLEGLVSTFMLTAILWFFCYLNDRNIKSLIISGFFSGLSVLTKTSALFLIPFMALSSLLYYYRDEKSIVKAFKSVFKPLLVWFGVLVLTFFALWPALWVKPIEVFQTLYSGIVDIGVEGDHIQYYFGKLVDNPGPSFYFVVLGLRSSIYLLVGFIGVLIVRGKLPEYYKRFLDYLLIFIFFYFIQLTLPTKKLDRYILPLITIMLAASSIFFVWMFERLRFGWKKIAFFMIPVLLTTAYLHPDYLSYYNPAFGGLRVGIQVLEPKWTIGVRPLIDYFRNVQQKDGDTPSYNVSFEQLVYTHRGAGVKTVLTVAFAEKYYSQVWPFFRKIGAWPVIENLTPFADKTKYFVYPVWDDASKIEKRYTLLYVDSVKLRGVPIYNVYVKQNYDKSF